VTWTKVKEGLVSSALKQSESDIRPRAKMPAALVVNTKNRTAIFAVGPPISADQC
jgi:hypothetical protein